MTQAQAVNKKRFNSRYILSEMVKKNVKSQYRNSVLGILWTVLNPLLNMLVLSLVFSFLFGRGIQYYPVYLLSGNIVFTLMRATTSNGLTCIENNASLITKVKIPYYVFPVSTLLSALVNFAFSFVALLVVMVITGVPFSFYMLLTIPFLPSLLLFSLGISLILSTLYVFFRDTEHLYGVILTLWTYCTPLFYQIESLGEGLLMRIMQFNPMYHYVNCFRDLIMYSTFPGWTSVWICYGFGALFFLIGVLFFNWKKRKFILYI